MNELWWLIIGFFLRTFLRPFAVDLARGWYHLTFCIVSFGVGPQARLLWEDEVFGDLELEIWEGLKDPRLSHQDVAVRVLRRSVDLLWDGWAQRAAHIADAKRAGARWDRSEDTAAPQARFGWVGTRIKVGFEAIEVFLFAPQRFASPVLVSFLWSTVVTVVLMALTFAYSNGWLSPRVMASMSIIVALSVGLPLSGLHPRRWAGWVGAMLFVLTSVHLAFVAGWLSPGRALMACVIAPEVFAVFCMIQLARRRERL